MSGGLDMNVGDWTYQEVTIAQGASPTRLIANATDFINSTNNAADGDTLLWIAIKHTGTTNGTNVTQESIMIGYDTANPTYNGADSASTNGMLVEPNELFIFKPLRTDIEDVTAITVGGIASHKTGDVAQGTSTVKVIVAAKIYDGD
jgi:hypothetical protein